jgi:AAA domain
MFESKEAANFDTIGVDSFSQLAEMVLTEKLAKNRDGRKAYGEMSIEMMGLMNDLYYYKYKHIYGIAKQGILEDGDTAVKRPYFPGQDLNVKIPHLFDLIGHIAKSKIPGMVGEHLAIRCQPAYGITARDRSGNLAELEQPDLSKLFAKAMA